MNTANGEPLENLNLQEDVNDNMASEQHDPAFNYELKEYITAKMQEVFNNGLKVGFQTACHVGLDKLYAFENKPGNKSTNDYKRCHKDLKKFFETGLFGGNNESEQIKTNKAVEAEATQN